MPKVLFLGCSNLQLPYLRAAKTLGFNTILTDANVKSPGKTLADKYYCASYTDIEALLGIAERENLSSNDLIFTAATQFAYEGAAIVAADRAINFLSTNNVDIVLDKVKFYTLLKSMSIPIPLTFPFKIDEQRKLEPDKVYYLKSDYGKSPNYCYRVIDGILPSFPERNDIYYRNSFLLQEEVIGVHYRINILENKSIIFKKESDLRCLSVDNVGGQSKLINLNLVNVVLKLNLTRYIVKFDIVVKEDNWWVLDIGIDPPMRFRLLCDNVKINFPMAYVKYYLTGDSDLLPKYIRNGIAIDTESYGIH